MYWLTTIYWTVLRRRKIKNIIIIITISERKFSSIFVLPITPNLITICVHKMSRAQYNEKYNNKLLLLCTQKRCYGFWLVIMCDWTHMMCWNIRPYTITVHIFSAVCGVLTAQNKCSNHVMKIWIPRIAPTWNYSSSVYYITRCIPWPNASWSQEWWLHQKFVYVTFVFFLLVGK